MEKIIKSSLKWDDFVFEELSRDAFVAYRKDSTFWMTLNNTGYRIFKMISVGFTAQEIINKLAETYQIPKEYIEHDFNEFVDNMNRKLENAELIKQKEDEPSNFKKLPKSMTIHITNKCNLNCPYCYKDANSNIYELSKDEVIKLIDEAYSIGFSEFIFSGGEPTLRTDLFEMLEVTKSKYPEIRLNLITNGTTEVADRYIDVMVNIIQISIDSSEEKINSKTRGVGSVEKIKRFCNKLAQRGFKSYYFACVPYTSGMGDKANIQGVPYLLRFAAYMGAKGLYVNMLKPNGRMSLDEYQKFNVEEFMKCIDECGKELDNLYNIGYHELSLFAASDFKHILVEHKHRAGCSAGILELAIDNDGKVYPCTSLMIPEFLLGNIRNNSIEELYDFAYNMFKDITVDHMEGCKECPSRYICGGGCRAIAYMLKNDISAKNPFCEHGKARIELWQKMSLRIQPKI